MNYSSISRHRAVLMGLAIIGIILFHVPLSRGDMFFGLKRMGNVGVDVFFLLSGVGLWFAWSKKPSVMHFYRRRLLRIMPAWMVVATAFYLTDWLGAQRFSSSPVDLIGDITINWDFWLHDELTFWYIPATLALYLVAPWYMRLIASRPAYRWLPVLMVVWCVAVQYVLPLHAAVGHIEIFWSRVPIFFIGIGLSERIRTGQTIDASARGLLVLTLVATLSLCLYLEQARHGRFPLFLERMVYIPMTLSGLMLLAQWIERWPQRLRSAIAWVGAISLETYLIHCQFVLLPISKYGWGYWPTALACIAITLPIAWVLHTVLERLIDMATRSHKAKPV